MMTSMNNSKNTMTIDIVFAINGVPVLGSGGTRILNQLIKGLNKRGVHTGALFLSRKTWSTVTNGNPLKRRVANSVLWLNDTRIGFHLINPIVKRLLHAADDGKVEARTKFFSIDEFMSHSCKYLIATNFVNASQILQLEIGSSRKFLFTQIDETDEVYSGNRSTDAKNIYDMFPNKIVLNDVMINKFPGSKKIMVGINRDIFYLMNEIVTRNPNSVLFILRAGRQKDPETALRAIQEIHESDPSVTITAFGSLNSKLVPRYVKYYEKPSNTQIARLMNHHSIFVLTSVLEGTPAPPLEAMACGCAIISTDCIGIREYVSNNINGLIVPTGDWRGIAHLVLELVSQNELRISLALKGMEDTKGYNFENMVDTFLSAISFNDQ